MALESGLSRTTLRTLPDRIRQVVLFEVSGLLLVAPPFAVLSGAPLTDSFGLLAVLSLIAALWNAVYSSLFDWIEARRTGRTADRRPTGLRLAHAAGFEGGLLTISLPVVVYATGMSLGAALLADLGLALAYTVYAYLFNLLYDRLFPIAPRS